MKKLFSALLVAVLLSFNLAAADLAAIDGLYEEVDPIQPTADAKRVEVLEVFWYACGVCNNFRPYMAQYELTKPAHVNLVRMPAVMGPEQRAHAQVFYAAAALNALEKTHQATYDAIHTDKKRMADAAEIKEVFTKAGAD
ncbi:MAG: hypothetical protein HOI95_07155, partial [Chromatiales bacterium]|nr:hypothetical protein [Chromatiales bacterium]